MSYSRFIRWVLANMDKIPQAISHAKEVWAAIAAQDAAATARESGEFLIWLGVQLESMPEYAGTEASSKDLAAIERSGIRLSDLQLLWDLIRLLLPITVWVNK